MNIRTATKIMTYRAPDPTRKPSEQIPYSDGQIVEAHRVYRMGLKRWKRADPSMTTRPKWGGSENRRSLRARGLKFGSTGPT